MYGVLGITNYILDPANIFLKRKVLDSVIKGFERGLCVTNVYNLDDRTLKKRLVQLHKDGKFDYLILGSSRSMLLSEESFDGKTVLNLSVSNCQIEDLVALIQICKEQNISYNRVIFLAEPALLNINNKDSRWRSIADFYYKRKNANLWSKFRNRLESSLIVKLFSLSYFRSSIDFLLKKNKHINNLKYSTTYINEGFTYRPDGSIYYDKKYRERSQKKIDEEAMSYNHQQFDNFDKVSIERKEEIRQIISELNSVGGEVYLMFVPYHPIFYDRLQKETKISEAKESLEGLAEECGVKEFGSYIPDSLDMNGNDFYDAMHLRKEIVDKLIKKNICK